MNVRENESDKLSPVSLVVRGYASPSLGPAYLQCILEKFAAVMDTRMRGETDLRWPKLDW